MATITLPVWAIMLIAVGTYPVTYWLIKSLIRAPKDLAEFVSKVWSDLKPSKLKV